MEKAKLLIKKIFKLLMKPEMRILPGQLAFFLVITLIPLVALIATIAANLSISTDGLASAIQNSVPPAVASVFSSVVSGSGISINMIVFYVSAFILASNGAFSMINTSNEIYKVQPNNAVSRRLKAVTMTFVLVGLFLFLLLVPVFGNTLFDILNQVTNNNIGVRIVKEMMVILKYPIILIIIYMNIKLMYVIAPDKEIPGKTTTKGAIFTTVGWIISTEIFAFYIDQFARYDEFYGSISNILILLLWIYLLSYIYVLGMVINASDYNGELD